MPKKFKCEVKGIGTGMIMDAQGHILTNHHVAYDAVQMQSTVNQNYLEKEWIHSLRAKYPVVVNREVLSKIK